MKLLYFGTICDLEHYESMLTKCKKKPTVATIVFESSLMAGFKSNDTDIEIHSFPMIPTFPHSNILHFGGSKESLPCGYRCYWLNTINIPIFKQWSRRLDARRIMRNWIKNNGSKGVILTYSIPPFLVKDIIKYGKKHSVKTVAIVPDLPQNMYINHKQKLIASLIKKLYLNLSLKFQGEFDGYVYLTDAMAEVINPTKPYIVMEGILDTSKCRGNENVNKSNPRGIMYAGGLNKKYGILNLVDAFESADIPNTELWLFGDGDAFEIIKLRAQKNPKIILFGRRNRDEVLEYEQKATLLVNPRSCKEDFTKYSFPSKTIEYMSTGTPLLTTKLSGIPEEYFKYVFTAEDNDVDCLASILKEIFSMSESELKEKGKQAQSFVINEKNAKIQSKHILDFLLELGK